MILRIPSYVESITNVRSQEDVEKMRLNAVLCEVLNDDSLWEVTPQGLRLKQPFDSEVDQ